MSKRSHASHSHGNVSGYDRTVNYSSGASIGRAMRVIHNKRHKSHHSSIVRHARRAMEVTSNGPATKKSKHDHEARMIPGLGPLQYGFPQSIITTVRYCDLITVTNSAATVDKYIYRANGIFDPNYTGGGHQPMWRDNYASIYNQYVVLGSKITVKFQSDSTDESWVVGILGDDDATTPTNILTLMELNNSVWDIHGTSHAGHTELFMTYEPERDLGTNAKDDGYFATTNVGGDAPVQWFYVVYVYLMNAADSGKILNYTVDIEYTVKFSNLKTQAQN